MLKGVPPFTAEEIRDVLRMQRYDPPPPLPQSVPPAVAGLVMTLLAKDPAERVQTAEGVIEYIDKLIDQLGTAPPPKGLGDRIRAKKCYEHVTAFDSHPLAPDAREALYRLQS